MRVEQEKKIFNVGDHLFESKVALGAEKMISLFFEFANRVLSAFESPSDSFMPSHDDFVESFPFFVSFSFQDAFYQPSGVDQKHSFILDNNTAKNSQELKPFFIVEFI